VKATLTGVDDVAKMLEQIAPREANNIMRATVHGVAGTISKDARNNSPEDEGDLKKAIKHKRERSLPGRFLSTVRVNPTAFYWRFVEYGQGPDGEEQAMFLRAVEAFRRDMDRTFVTQFGKKWEAALKRAARRNAG